MFTLKEQRQLANLVLLGTWSFSACHQSVLCLEITFSLMLHPDLALWLYLVKKLLQYLTPLFSLGYNTPV